MALLLLIGCHVNLFVVAGICLYFGLRPVPVTQSCRECSFDLRAQRQFADPSAPIRCPECGVVQKLDGEADKRQLNTKRSWQLLAISMFVTPFILDALLAYFTFFGD